MWLDLLSSLGLGEQATAAAVFMMIGWYLLRGKSFLGSIVGAVGTMTTIALAVVGVLAVAVGFGWFDPQPARFFSHMSTAVQAVWDAVGDAVLERLSEVVA